MTYEFINEYLAAADQRPQFGRAVMWIRPDGPLGQSVSKFAGELDAMLAVSSSHPRSRRRAAGRSKRSGRQGSVHQSPSRIADFTRNADPGIHPEFVEQRFHHMHSMRLGGIALSPALDANPNREVDTDIGRRSIGPREDMPFPGGT